MEYIQQSVVVSGVDENATSQNENNQARGGGIINSQPKPLSYSDNPLPHPIVILDFIIRSLTH